MKRGDIICVNNQYCVVLEFLGRWETDNRVLFLNCICYEVLHENQKKIIVSHNCNNNKFYFLQLSWSEEKQNLIKNRYKLIT